MKAKDAKKRIKAAKTKAETTQDAARQAALRSGNAEGKRMLPGFKKKLDEEIKKTVKEGSEYCYLNIGSSHDDPKREAALTFIMDALVTSAKADGFEATGSSHWSPDHYDGDGGCSFTGTTDVSIRVSWEDDTE